MADPHDSPAANAARGLLSVRVIIEGLAVIGIAWLASTVQQQNTAVARMQVQLSQVQAMLSDVPRITRDLAQMQIQIAEHERRIGRVEDRANARPQP